MLEDLKVAIVHEWLASRAGSEKTFEALAKLFPNADLFALTINPEVDFDLDRHVQTTMLQVSQLTRDRRGLTLPVMPLAWRCLGRPSYDLVLTSSHAFANYFPARTERFLSYVHTPLRFGWTPEIDGRGSGIHHAVSRAFLRALDRRGASRVSHFAANSNETARRIQRFYGRSSTVIFPPVDTDLLRPAENPADHDGYILGFSRWVPYKRLDLVIRVGEALGMPVVIAGRGPEAQNLHMLAATASVPVQLVESPSDAEVLTLYQRARVLVFPAIEDFGIVPVEAQACGTPVVGVGIGGSRDTIVDGVTGALAEDQSLDSLVVATKRALGLGTFVPAGVAHAASFSERRFLNEIEQWVASTLTN